MAPEPFRTPCNSQLSWHCYIVEYAPNAKNHATIETTKSDILQVKCVLIYSYCSWLNSCTSCYFCGTWHFRCIFNRWDRRGCRRGAMVQSLEWWDHVFGYGIHWNSKVETLKKWIVLYIYTIYDIYIYILYVRIKNMYMQLCSIHIHI